MSARSTCSSDRAGAATSSRAYGAMWPSACICLPCSRGSSPACRWIFANPVWVRADTVDLERHVVRVTLPPPGTLAPVRGAVARLHAQPLDRTRPLWRFHVIEGLQDGGLGFYTKIHHATLDGASGVALAHALLDLSPTPRKVEAPRRRRPDHPGLVALVGTAFKVTGSQTVNLVRQLPALARVAAKLLTSSTGFSRNLAFGRALRSTVSSMAAAASRPLHCRSPKCGVIATARGVTLNDVVLALVSGALRTYMKPRGGVPKKSMVAAMPVSLREAGNTEATTLATMTLASLATNVPTRSNDCARSRHRHARRRT